ncbi:DMT family transporter [Methylopila sp. 73B]|uniref:DMT family transporter n=1 Tax=Methylopila sp. 73B TaxID=1120792 RepID=UPI000370C208|nr:DMT family transporter [Methylopila sp. 73B]
MLSKLLLGLPVLAVGAGVALQSIVNSGLAQRLGSPVAASAVSFWVGTIALTTAAVAMGVVGPAFASARDVALGWWIGGGLLGAAFIVVVTLSVPKLGVAATIAFVIAGQLLCAALLDHFGVFGVPVQPLSFLRLVGIATLFVGALLVRLF